MKIRLGFVSNSSTSSYVCVVCGDVEAGFELSIGDTNKRTCVNGHTFCEGCDKKLLETVTDEDSEFDLYEVPSKYCPVCNFLVLDELDVIDYFLKKHRTDRTSIMQDIKKRFNSYADFMNYLNGNTNDVSSWEM